MLYTVIRVKGPKCEYNAVEIFFFFFFFRSSLISYNFLQIGGYKDTEFSIVQRVLIVFQGTVDILFVELQTAFTGCILFLSFPFLPPIF